MCWVHDQLLKHPYQERFSEVVSRSVVLDRGGSQVAVGIVGRIVSETSPVGRSIPV